MYFNLLSVLELVLRLTAEAQILQSLIAIISPFHFPNISSFLKFGFHSSTELSLLVYDLLLQCLSTEPRVYN